MIAEAAHVRRRYPQAPEDAVQHLLWALHRSVPAITADRTLAAETGLRSDLASYPGSMQDFAWFNLPALIDALRVGRIAVADQLGYMNLLQPGGTR